MNNDKNIFYDVRGLPYAQQELLLRKAYSVCERWWFDKLDCSVSCARQVIAGVSFEEAMSHFGKGAFVSVIHRRQVIPVDEHYLEVGFRSMESQSDYFLWIIVPLDKADEIVDGLKVMK